MQIILTNLPKGWCFSPAANLKKKVAYSCWKTLWIYISTKPVARQVSTISLILSLLQFDSDKWPATITSSISGSIRMFLFQNPYRRNYSERNGVWLVYIQLLIKNHPIATISIEHHHVYVKSKDMSIILANFLVDECPLAVFFWSANWSKSF